MRSIYLKYRAEVQVAMVSFLLSMMATILISYVGLPAGIILPGVTASLLLLILTFTSYQYGYLVLVLYAFFMFHLYRVTPATPYFPMGVIIEILLALLVAAIALRYLRKDYISISYFKNPVSYAILIYCSYLLILLFNPASRATLGRVLGLREIITFLVLFFVSVHVFKTYSFIYFFSRFWICLAALAALYASYQEIIGLQDWELRWLYSQPDQGQLAIVWGHIRKWSFLSDINAFGLLMAYSGIFCVVLAMGPFTLMTRLFYAALAVLMFAAMTFSGTRTAMAMVVVGIGFYVAMTLYDGQTLLLVVVFAVGMLALFIGPFYGPNFNRLRSTFEITSDASMNVRDQTRERMKPYARSHPFGGGVNTTGALGLKYDPGHPLAGHWDPDSGYLKTALERGWIGLLLQLGLYTTIVIYGLNFFYRTNDPVAATYCSAYLCCFFALTIANYAQDSLEQKPINLIVMASIASLITFTVLEKQKNRTNEA